MGTPPLDRFSPQPTRVRLVVLAFMCTLSLLTYLDRICIMRVSETMEGELGLDDVQMGWVFSAFLVGYALLEVPGGWMGDVWGSRRVLARIVLCWSAFTALTGCVWYFQAPEPYQVFVWGYPLVGSFGLLVLVRFLFGAGEAGAYPNITRVTRVWFPARERAGAQGAVWMSARLGGALAPPVIGSLTLAIGWREAFWVLGGLGLVWAAAFLAWFRDRPEDTPACNAAEREWIREGDAAVPVPAAPAHAVTTKEAGVRETRPDDAVAAGGHAWPPVRALLTNLSVWGMCVAAFAVCFGWYFYPTWQPKYLKEAFGISYENSELLTGLPFLCGAVGAMLGGWLSDLLVRRTGSRRFGRAAVGIAGFTGAGLCVLGTGFVSEAWQAVTLLCLAFFINDLAIPTIWAASADVGGRFAGTVSGLMNMVGAVGGMLGPVLIPVVLRHLDYLPTVVRWQYIFAGMGAAWFVAAASWLVIDAGKPLADNR
jgi:MFS family permease